MESLCETSASLAALERLKFASDVRERLRDKRASACSTSGLHSCRAGSRRKFPAGFRLARPVDNARRERLLPETARSGEHRFALSATCKKDALSILQPRDRSNVCIQRARRRDLCRRWNKEI